MQPAPYVMLVDDDATIAEMYSFGLRADGFRAATVTDVSGLVAALELELPNIVVLDWQLVGMTGGEVLELLRLDVRTASLPVFILSNYEIDHEAMDRLFAAGAMAWLTKSKVTPIGLARQLRAWLAERRPAAR